MFDWHLQRITQTADGTTVYVFECNCTITQTSSGRIFYGAVGLCNLHRKEME